MASRKIILSHTEAQVQIKKRLGEKRNFQNTSISMCQIIYPLLKFGVVELGMTFMIQTKWLLYHAHSLKLLCLFCEECLYIST